jgi:iron complex outermembrane receptor protein
MMISEKTIARSVRLIFSSGVALGAVLATPSVMAQTATTGQAVQRVEITGSHIRRSEAETSTAVQTLTRADIEKSGKTSVAELLQTLAVDNQGSVPTTFGNGFAAGASGISLRGLGSASTLVLLNGRRIAPYGLADDGQKVFADLNIIPMEAVERVEIMKEGASAVYGSDAIAGVVNIILRKDYVGTTLKANTGMSGYGDGNEAHLAVTHGMGDLENDKYNVLFNLEYNKKRQIWARDRDDRAYIGRADLRDYGFSAQEALGGTGAITGKNASGSAINGNVRNPATTYYYNRGNLDPATGFTRTFPGAACSNFTTHPQGDPGGGCLIDASQAYSQLQPSQESGNGFVRGTFQLNAETQAYAEANVYKSRSESWSTPSGVSSSVGYPGGPVSNSLVSLGAAHPDNPYFGTAAVLRYLAADVGPRTSKIDSTFTRFVAGVKGTIGEWDYDTAALFSQNTVSNHRTGYLQRDVAFALLNPGDTANVASARNNSPAYAALPAGTYWRIGENAKLNSAALYAALSPMISNDAHTKVSQVDFHASRELGHLPGGAMGLAVGAEYRHESTELQPTSGTDRGNIIGLGYSAYKGDRNVGAVYGELVAPLLKSLEATIAARADHYSDVGSSYNPKVGLKWSPVKSFALRGTFEKGFRAPSAAENGVGGLAAFSSAPDPVRCAIGVATACKSATVAIITSPNPGLQPERSKSYNLGMIWDPAPRTSVSMDLWQITRNNEINQETTSAALAAGHVSRDPSTSTKPGDPGAITAVLANYVNSAQTQVRGLDLDVRQGFELGAGVGKLTFGANWTHLFKWERTELDGFKMDFAGTHGNCDVSNCMGTPDDRVNLSATWELNTVRVAAMANYRGSIADTAFKNDPAGCAMTFADGTDAPANCRLASFTTIDLTARWQATPKLEVFGSIQNVFNRVAPLDPLTYGAVSYNPLDYSGAMGRYFSAGVKYKF